MRQVETRKQTLATYIHAHTPERNNQTTSNMNHLNEIRCHQPAFVNTVRENSAAIGKLLTLRNSSVDLFVTTIVIPVALLMWRVAFLCHYPHPTFFSPTFLLLKTTQTKQTARGKLYSVTGLHKVRFCIFLTE